MPIKYIKKAARYAHHHSTKKAAYMHEKFKEHASTAIIAALSFLIAFSWKDFIVKIIKENIKFSLLEKYPYLAELYTATLVTIIAIIGIVLVSKWASKPEAVKK